MNPNPTTPAKPSEKQQGGAAPRPGAGRSDNPPMKIPEQQPPDTTPVPQAGGQSR